MAERPFRFIAAGDLRLERPVAGLSTVPEALAAPLIDAPYDAARRVFDAALASPVDFLLLVGRLTDVSVAGPRGCLFLLTQFERLAAREVPVYLLEPHGASDWPAQLTLPANVIRLNSVDGGTIPLMRDGRKLAVLHVPGDQRLTSASYVDPLLSDVSFTIVALADEAHAPRIPQQTTCVIYGGRTSRATQPKGMGTAHWPGMIHSAGPDELGPHGCTLLEWDLGALLPRVIPIDADPVRWLEQTVVLPRELTLATLETMLAEQAQQLAAQNGDRTLLVRWKLQGSGTMAESLRRQSVIEPLLGRLRDRVKTLSQAVWHASIEMALAAPHVAHDDTLLDHYLQHFEGTAQAESPAVESLFSLAEAAPAGWPTEQAARWITPPAEQDARQRIISEAAWLGVDLLSAGENRR